MTMTTVVVPHESPQRQEYSNQLRSVQETLITCQQDQTQSHPSLQAKLHEAREQNRIFGSANSQASINDVPSNALNQFRLHGKRNLCDSQFQIFRHFSLSDPTRIFSESSEINGSQSFAESSIHKLMSQKELSSKDLDLSKEDEKGKGNAITGEDEKEQQTDKETRGWGTRHGFEDHYASEEYVSQLANNWYMYYTDKRHETTGNPKVTGFQLQEWRMRDRLKTVSAALAVCLNIGVEPPDQLKTNPGCKLEAWQDPLCPPVQKALENIGKSLQEQYETLSIRTRYKQYLDPTIEETRRFCLSLRRNAKDERILFHYNGHGVPKPTPSGEIWVFNKNYTQYIPVSLYDLQTWLQAPTIYVWDCSGAGNILSNFHRFVDKHKHEDAEIAKKDRKHIPQKYEPFIHLVACDVNESLPSNSTVPADIFTSCLTTPIEMALWNFVLRTPLDMKITPERAKKMPGRLQERRTPLGELNWIFTAITDTIAWTTLPQSLFRKFFRQDLMVAALLRNFLQCQRIMFRYNCHPLSYPQLPDTSRHPLWASWDLALEMALAQLPMLEDKESGSNPDYEFQHSTFFSEQLTAFEVYLTQGGGATGKAPEQLPIVLQVLLSQQHRVRALVLLGKFLDMGPWAVNLALSIGIFPYVLKLLQSAAHELRPVMVFIWARILAVDISCQADLLKDKGYLYFATILKPNQGLPVVDSLEHKAMCAFIMARLCDGYQHGQITCNETDIMSYCLVHLQNLDNPLLRQWACICISQLWKDFSDAKWRGIKENALVKLAFLIRDNCAEVRAAMLYAMTLFLGIEELTDEVIRIEENITWTIIDMSKDGNAMVRKEVLVYLSKFIHRYENRFFVAACEQLCEERDYKESPPSEDGNDLKMGLHYVSTENQNDNGSLKVITHGLAHNSIFAMVWKHVLIMSVDPHPEVQRNASVIVDYIYCSMFQSPIGNFAEAIIDDIKKIKTKSPNSSQKAMELRPNTPSRQGSVIPAPQTPGLLKRTASYFFAPFAVANTESLLDTSNKQISKPSSQRNSLSIRSRSSLGLKAPHEEDEAGKTTGGYHLAKKPTSGGFQTRKITDPPTLPLKSNFYDWSIEYFREPQMKPHEAEEPGSTEYNERLWRCSRNEAILLETQSQKDIAASGRWNIPSGSLNNNSQSGKMIYHQFEDHLAVADDRDTIYIWDWRKQERLSKFSNGNPESSKINDIRFINEDDQALVMTGSSDGVIRVYRNYDNDKKIELASAWRALTNIVPSNINVGMVLDWQQVNGRILVAGDHKVIKVWSAASELCLAEINARSGSCITSLTSDQMTGNIFVAGFGDGAIRIFDARNKPQEAMVKRWKDDTDKVWLKCVHMQRGGQRELVAASRNGKVRFWDIRMDKPLRTFRTTNQVLRTASVHEHFPVFAIGTGNHTVKIFNFAGKELSRFQPNSNFLNQAKQNPIVTTTFHPHRMILACAARRDNHVNIFTCPENQNAQDLALD
ncbi:Target of rapamycin complex 1 subunit mip1 [Erysiphe neolycopersici]|uniref:Target of rapamycin complex 1 subunit mip1 n=1 Tax=Erysiphe neolycopersici TaxID=212602 RepID=A0A420I300_9PEZI|nr:Target of rapamycin complex 1 subunit mip1 [Erysiphe neolycopersici]